MAISSDKSDYATDGRTQAWCGRPLSAASDRASWGHDVNVARRDAPLDYAVMTGSSAFPAGWLRFNAELEGYTFCSLLPGREAAASTYADPQHAVPAWVGAYVLRAIHPIPEEFTGDMLAAAPAMLAVLKQLRALMAEDESRLPELDLDDLDRVLAIAEGQT